MGSNKNLVELFKNYLKAKPTEELASAWERFDCDEYRQEELEAIREILEERGVPISPKSFQLNDRSENIIIRPSIWRRIIEVNIFEPAPREILREGGVPKSKKLFQVNNRVNKVIIRPSTWERIFGIAAIIFGVGCLLQATKLWLVVILAFLTPSNAVGISGALGGAIAISIVIYWVFKFSIDMLKSFTVDEAINMLKSQNEDKRRRAAGKLVQIGYTAENKFLEIRILVLAGKWEDAVSRGPIGVLKVIGALKSAPVKSDILKALGDSNDPRAIKPLIDFLKDKASFGDRGNVAIALKKLTGKELRASHKDWLKWWEKTHVKGG